ncbi:DUF6493 family protein [Lentzea sp. BCCO 10_0798]|uniref:DUF6493 family protein n=1 Tax=Lentzea kristufekii TaxID=3095430 RepID=A0ABU4U5I3_9PSEU|nr:DUF6493 family protein [Lentzea sp. BCCO 10_0798]MDX8055822.1 DUF6493 family protein [Lentzea sp. BCCO 10_0798]
MTFARIQALIESGRAYPLGEALKGLTAEQRKECAKDLIAYEKAHRASDGRWQHGEPLAIAGAGLLPSASALTPWLVRYPISMHHSRRHDDNAGALVDVLRHRELTWMPDLVTRIAARMPTRERWRQDLLHVVLEFCGDDPPDSDGFLLHFMDSGVHTRWKPAFDTLIPRMLEVVGSGGIMGARRQWPEFLRDRADRQVLLDGCLARLQQGGTAAEVGGFLVLHEVIEVTVEEIAAHARDYVAMLPDSRSTVAGLAQDQLKRLDDAGRLDFGLLCEASRWVFGRTEKKLVRAQLTWLGKHGKANPDEVVLTAAELFAHKSDDLRGQAVKLIAKHLGNARDTTQAEVRALAEQLPGDLAEQLGGITSQEQAPELAAFEPRPFPSLIATLDELTGELLSAFGRNSSYVEPSTAERIIEAVVRFAWQDREALGEAIRPFSENTPWFDDSQHTPRSELIGAVLDARDKPRPLKHGVSTEVDFARNRKPEHGIGAVGDELAKRLYEIGRGLVHLPKPALVSTPTEMSGLIDPATLADRLARAEAEGWEPWQRDLRQAVQRLPRDTDTAVFASLTSKAAAKVRDWLASRTDPEIAIVERTYRHPWRYSSYMAETGLYATVTPGLEEPEQFLRDNDGWGPMMEWWPSSLPVQREVVAAHLVPHLRARTASKGADGPLLPMLAEAHGPAGPALHLALSYGLGAELTVNRAHAVDAVLILAARDQLDGRTLGDFLGRLLERGDLVMNRVVPCLRDAARSGAARQIWDALTTAVPRLWTHNRVADVIELAVELAQRLQPGGTVGGLAEVAARKGSSKAVVQAKRLMSALGGTA